MADLSTPLLDTVIDKLANPTLECRTLANENSTITAENAAVETLQGMLSNEQLMPPSLTPIIAPRTIQPSTIQPTTPLYCPDDVTGPRQIDGCSGENLT